MRFGELRAHVLHLHKLSASHAAGEAGRTGEGGIACRLWPSTVADFDHGLNKAISTIREALGDSVESPRFVETVARRAYRFLADVAVIDTVMGSVRLHLTILPSPRILLSSISLTLAHYRNDRSVLMLGGYSASS
jgi:hypothetical protein